MERSGGGVRGREIRDERDEDRGYERGRGRDVRRKKKPERVG